MASKIRGSKNSGNAQKCFAPLKQNIKPCNASSYKDVGIISVVVEHLFKKTLKKIGGARKSFVPHSGGRKPLEHNVL